jgi:hypothetical protein
MAEEDLGVFEQAARDLVDSANAGSQVAVATLKLVGDNARKGKPFRAVVTYELAMRYAKQCGGDMACHGALARVEGEPVPQSAYEWLWRRVSRGMLGDRTDLFAILVECARGREAVTTALALGPRLTPRRIDSLLKSFRDDSVGRQLCQDGISDPDGHAASAAANEAGEDGDIILACHMIGASISDARARQEIVCGNFRVLRELCVEMGEPTREEYRRG